MTRSGIEPRSPRPLVNILPTRPMSWLIINGEIFLTISDGNYLIISDNDLIVRGENYLILKDHNYSISSDDNFYNTYEKKNYLYI